jgi:hypothetical protein
LNKRFGMLIESQGPTPAQPVVERSVYSHAVGPQGRARAEPWAAPRKSLQLTTALRRENQTVVKVSSEGRTS